MMVQTTPFGRSHNGMSSPDGSHSDEDWEAISDDFSVLSFNSFMLLEVDTFTYKEMLLKPPSYIQPNLGRSENNSHEAKIKKNQKVPDSKHLFLEEDGGINSWHEETATRYHKQHNGHTLRRPPLNRDGKGSHRDVDPSAKVMDRDHLPANKCLPRGLYGGKGDRKWVRRQKRNERHRRKESKEVTTN